MLLNYGAGENCCKSLGLQGDQASEYVIYVKIINELSYILYGMKCQKLVQVLEYIHLYQINDISSSILDCIHFGQLKIHIELCCGKLERQKKPYNNQKRHYGNSYIIYRGFWISLQSEYIQPMNILSQQSIQTCPDLYFANDLMTHYKRWS